MTADCKPYPAEQGREAYGDDKTLDDNPYVMGTPEYVTWDEAFEEARKNDPLADICGGDNDDSYEDDIPDSDNDDSYEDDIPDGEAD